MARTSTTKKEDRKQANPASPPANALSSREAAAFIGVAPQTLANWRSAGIGPVCVQYNSRNIVYLVEDLEAFRQAHRTAI